jgi:uncharacterized protein (TIGR03437 family)
VTTGCGLFSALLLCGCLAAGLHGQIRAPLYTPSSITNSANPNAPPLASNTIATIYGMDLAFGTATLTADQIRAATLPTVLIGAGVRVSVNNIQAALYYVSPGQINFLVPELRPGMAEIRVSRDGVYGPAVRVAIGEISPALFNMDPEFAIATQVDGSLLTRDNPARSGDVVILYATGLGVTRPRFLNGEIPSAAARLERIGDFRVMIAGRQMPAADILYAGVAPGFAGLYQINLRLPAELEPDPEIRIGLGDVFSPTGVRLHAFSGNP